MSSIKYYELIEKYKNNEIDIFNLIKVFDGDSEIKNKTSGIIYTPKYIADYIVRLVDPNKNEIVLEPSVGHGVFLFSLIYFIESKYNMSASELKEWFENKVLAMDISSRAIKELKLILTAFFAKKGILNVNYDNIFAADALKYNGLLAFDVVIGNPPYIRTKNLDVAYLGFLRKKYISCEKGNIDIYYAFIELFSKTAKRFSFIVPNSFMTNKSAKTLRNIMLPKVEKIVDFKDQLIFENARTYTSIFLLSDNETTKIKYNNQINSDERMVDRDNLNDEGWYFNDRVMPLQLSNEEKQQISITGSIATLRDRLFIFKNPIIEGDYYKIEQGKKSYLIEKDICVSLFKLTKPLETYFILNPYVRSNILSEKTLSGNYPLAYQYLIDNKDELNKRDKGKTSKYEAWYAYGRKQGLNIIDNAHYLFVPIMTNKPLLLDVKHIDKPFLITSGFCIQSKNSELLNKVSGVLSSDLFFDYIKSVGKQWPGSPVYYTITLNQLREFILN